MDDLLAVYVPLSDQEFDVALGIVIFPPNWIQAEGCDFVFATLTCLKTSQALGYALHQ
jgi:hypothetical protein